MAAHPLTRPAFWALRTGAPAMPLLRWAGTLLWAAGALMGIAWLLALTDDALAGYLHPAYPLAAWPAVLAWLSAAWLIWRGWFARSRVLTLEWHGPVVHDQLDSACASGGFHVGQWQAPVRVRIALSMQGWWLLCLTPVRCMPEEGATYAWLDARETDLPCASSRDLSLHQLRTLLHLPPSMTTLDDGARASSSPKGYAAHKPVASWVHSFNPGFMLRRLASSFRSDRKPSIGSSSLLDTAFQATTVMADRRAAQKVAQVAVQRAAHVHDRQGRR